MNPRTVQAAAIDDRRVAVTFNNGVTGVLDVSPYFTMPGLARLRDPSFFRQAHAHHGTVVWDEDADLCPDLVWAKSVKRSAG